VAFVSANAARTLWLWARSRRALREVTARDATITAVPQGSA